MRSDRIRLLTIGGIIALLAAVIVVVVRTDRSRDLVLRVEPASDNDQITVYAGGAVVAPGLYTLPRGSRLASIIDRAGLSDGADTSTLQMASELRDGQQVIVPMSTPTAKLPVSPVTVPDPAETSTVVRMTGPININTASAADLEQLPGIGPSLAQRIVDYRTAHGPFSSVEHLADVQGISDRMVQDFGNLITVGT